MMNFRATNSAAIRRVRGHGARHTCEGFTIVELIIVTAVLLILAAMAIPSMQSAIAAAKISRTVGDVRTIGQAALGYYAEYGAAPNNLVDIGYDEQVDPWGNHYQYLGFTSTTTIAQMRTDSFGVPINTFFDLYSMGADQQTTGSLAAPQSQDDVIWANDGVYMGLASNY
jgi:general secretion pathway protein G